MEAKSGDVGVLDGGMVMGCRERRCIVGDEGFFGPATARWIFL